MTITFDIDIEDTVTFHRPPGGEDTRILDIHDMPSMPRRPGATAETADKTAFGLVATSDGEPPIFAQPPVYTARHRAKDPAEVVPPPVAPAESVPPFAPSWFRRLASRFGRIGG